MPDSGVNRDESSLKLGERLRSARKARAVSLERVAQALHLDEGIVLALEEERFDALGAPVFVRGHLRAYAKLLGLDAETLLTAYEPDKPEEVVTPAVEQRVGRSVTINPMILGVSVLAVCVVVALSTYVLQGDDAVAPDLAQRSSEAESMPIPSPAASDSQQPKASSPKIATAVSASAQATEPSRRSASIETAPPVAAPTVAESTPSAPAQGEPAQGEPAQGESTRAESTQAESTRAESTRAEPNETVARPPADGIRLSLLFREASWVEISDVNQRLIFGLQREGRRREVVGEPPISLLLGNAKGVELSVNDEPYVVPSSRVNGQVARFEIDADTLP
jgi:cytoskeleton protein RodZ